MTRASVTFVGAGPGADDLITLRGLRRVRDADVIVHDRLVPAGLLAEARVGAEIIDVGKTPGRGHGSTQAQINALIVDRAYRGRRVVRLKGGDPAVFGRLAEEIRAVRAAGLSYEIVPGVTAALAAAALAGVSLTERGVVSSIVLVTGTGQSGHGMAALDWSALARLDGTLVFYMAMRCLDDIVTTLLAFGRDPDEPAAVVERVGTREERVVAAPLAAIVDGAHAAHVTSPAVLLIGSTLTGVWPGQRMGVGSAARLAGPRIAG